MNERTEVTARGLITIGGHLLVAQGTHDPFCHAPGGHVEAGEQPVMALRRELQEELGRAASEVLPLTRLENVFDKGATRIREQMHLFAVKLYPELREVPPRSAEDHLTFRWIALQDMEREQLMPPALYAWARLIGGM